MTIRNVLAILALLVLAMPPSWAADPDGWIQKANPKAVAAIKAMQFPSLGPGTVGDAFADWTNCTQDDSSGWVSATDDNNAPVTLFICNQANLTEHITKYIQMVEDLKDPELVKVVEDLLTVKEIFSFSVGRSSGNVRLVGVYQDYEWGSSSRLSYTLSIPDTTAALRDAYQGQPWTFAPDYGVGSGVADQLGTASLGMAMVMRGIGNPEDIRILELLREMHNNATKQ